MKSFTGKKGKVWVILLGAVLLLALGVFLARPSFTGGSVDQGQQKSAANPASQPGVLPTTIGSASGARSPEQVKSDGGSQNADLVTAVTDASYQSEVLGSKKPVLIDFWATWCGPCRMYGPIVDQLAKDYAGRLKVVRVDVDQNPQLARSFQIQAIPASFLFKNGKVVKTWVGLVSENDLRTDVDKVVKPTSKKNLTES